MATDKIQIVEGVEGRQVAKSPIVFINDSNSIYNTMGVKKTTILSEQTSLLQVDDNLVNFFVVNKTKNTVVYIGNETVQDDFSANGFPIYYDEVLQFNNMQKNNENLIYVYNDSPVSVDVYSVGTYKE